jgi:hypothetical protein
MTPLPGRKIPQWLLTIAGGALVGVVAGSLMGWQFAPPMVLIYFAIGWGARQGQRDKKEVDAYREEWLDRRKSQGDGTPPTVV